jgi:hypothetical protein
MTASATVALVSAEDEGLDGRAVQSAGDQGCPPDARNYMQRKLRGIA